MPAHVHAELMRQYAEDAMTTDEPWKLWEKTGNQVHWSVMSPYEMFVPELSYRRKPRTININGHEVPKPMMVEPKRGDAYFVPDFSKCGLVSHLSWYNDETDTLYLMRGVCHPTQAAAEAHARALLSFTQTQAPQKD